MKRVLPILALCLAGCASTPHAPPAGSAPAPAPAPAATLAPSSAPSSAPAPGSAPASAPGNGRNTPAYFLAVVQADSDLIDTENLPSGRRRLVADARSHAERCLAMAPQDGRCHYARAIVYGLAAREQPLQAGVLLKNMLDSLVKAAALSPTIDHAGPARLQAIVLLRAPYWPLGPGDVDAGLAAAKQAVAVDPTFPGNQAILREAQKKAAARQ